MKKTFAFGLLVPNTEIIAAYEQGRLPNPKLSRAVETDVVGMSFVYHKDTVSDTPDIATRVDAEMGVYVSIPQCAKEQAELLFRTFPSVSEVSRQQLRSSPPHRPNPDRRSDTDAAAASPEGAGDGSH